MRKTLTAGLLLLASLTAGCGHKSEPEPTPTLFQDWNWPDGRRPTTTTAPTTAPSPAPASATGDAPPGPSGWIAPSHDAGAGHDGANRRADRRAEGGETLPDHRPREADQFEFTLLAQSRITG